ncbi:MAG: PQQ-dependent sugar dehydrogenase [Geminicoccaceae bacterium]
MLVRMGLGMAVVVTGMTAIAEARSVPQSEREAAQIRQVLQQVRLPPGFAIDLYAIVPGARHMAVGPSGEVTFVGTRSAELYAVVDRDRDGKVEAVEQFAPGLTFDAPNGPCFAPDGSLFVPEFDRIRMFEDAEKLQGGDVPAAVDVVPAGKLIPPEVNSQNHGARVCRIGPDDRLYVAIGQPFNVPPKKLRDVFKQWGVGGIVRMDRDGANREVFADGIRNSVGIDFRPGTSELWFSDNQVDRMGDDIPPGEINRATQAGQNFGFPWYGGGTVRTAEYRDERPPADAVPPVVEEVAHAADLGLTFYTGTMFPETYRGGIFSAQHGSWNRSQPVGARVMFTAVGKDGTARDSVPLAEGWLARSGEYLGRPVDVAPLPDGSILVSDDLLGALYRITYVAPE